MITPNTEISFNNKYLTLDGEPWFPIMGEIHYSRVRREDWKMEILKMKAGGVDIVSAYTIWIHHEEIEGKYNFEGQRDLRAFIETVKECGMSMILRIGPWAHGEARNGGFPDWLIEKEKCSEMTLRSNDAAYLKEVRKFYTQIFSQAKGLLHKDGGPIIGIQIENEYGHCGGFGGEEGEAHMRTLKEMAIRIGFEVPIYTATGWGGAVTGGMLPVMGGYCEAPWDQRLTEIEPSGNYIFTKERNDHAIGSDYGIGEGVTFEMDKFPYLTAELGGGLQVTKHRRPVATADDIAAMSLVKMGSGCNLLGYYMYHGGTNPDSVLTTLQESRETGYLNDLPVRSYDFNAPIREYGQLTDTYRQIRKLSYFIHDFGDRLCRMDMVEQPGNPSKPENNTDLRTSVRYNPETGEGYLFINNYQRRVQMATHENVTLRAFAEDGVTVLAEWDPTDIHDGDYFFRPFNMPLGDTVLLTASATPFCILHGAGEEGEDVYVFYTDDQNGPAYCFEDPQLAPPILTLTGEQALQAQKVIIDGEEQLIVGGDDVITDENGEVFSLVEEPAEGLHVNLNGNDDPVGETGKRLYRMQVWGIPKDVQAVICSMEWAGDTARAYRISKDFNNTLQEPVLADGTLLPCEDQFYTGQKWEIELKHLSTPEDDGDGLGVCLKIEVDPLRKDTPVFLEEWPEITEDDLAYIGRIDFKFIRKQKM